ncbi:MAG: outer membrane beta-barrel protein [Legionellales bacterium]|nr:outer membrane beta-barrel protein [Legionellales bacterium]
MKVFSLLFMLPSLGFAIQPGFYGDWNIGVSSGPSSAQAVGGAFVGSGGTIIGDVSELYGLTTRGSFGGSVDVGYNIIPNIGIEANYTYWGQQNVSTITGEFMTVMRGMNGLLYSQSVGGNLVAYFPLDQEKFNLYAKLGVAALFSTFKVDDPNSLVFLFPGSYSQNSAEPALTYGLGLQYQFNPHASLLLAWSGISQFKDTPISNLHYNIGSIGLRYTFPNQAPSVYQK